MMGMSVRPLELDLMQNVDRISASCTMLDKEA